MTPLTRELQPMKNEKPKPIVEIALIEAINIIIAINITITEGVMIMKPMMRKIVLNFGIFVASIEALDLQALQSS